MDWEGQNASLSREYSLQWIPKEPHSLGFLPVPEVSYGPISSNGGEMTLWSCCDTGPAHRCFNRSKSAPQNIKWLLLLYMGAEYNRGERLIAGRRYHGTEIALKGLGSIYLLNDCRFLREERSKFSIQIMFWIWMPALKSGFVNL